MTDPRRLATSAPFARPAPETEQTDEQIDLFGVLNTLWRGKWWILLATLLGMALGGYYAYAIATPLYTARSVVALEARQSRVVDMESVMSGLSADQATVNTEIELIRSRQLAERLVQDLGLTEDPEFNPALAAVEPWSADWLRQTLLGPGPEPNEAEAFDATVDQVLAAIDVSNRHNSYVFTIVVETTSPEKSAEIANRLAELYILDQLELKFEATDKATEWLGKQVASLKSDLETAEKRLKDFTTSTELVSPESLSALGVQLKDLRDRLAETETRTETVASRIAALEEAMDTASPAEIAEIADDSALTRMLERLEAGAASRELFDQRLDQVIQQARQELAREERQREVLQNTVTDLEGQIDRQSSELVTLEQLEREVEATALIYESFLSRLKETSVQQGLHEPDARVFSEAVVRRTPSAPRDGLVLGLAALLGFFAGSGMVLVRERLQNVFRTSEELERATGLPVLGEVPQAPTRQRRKLLDHVVSKPTSAFSEAVRNLRTSILLSDIDRPPNLVMLTSSVPGEGKTTQCLSLAQNLSMMGKKVLLIEADIRRRMLSEYLDLAGDEPGLIAATTGRQPFSEIVYRREELGFDILLGEKSQLNAADFFSSRRFADFLRAAKEAYDVVILDTPPVLAVPDARVIGQYADAIVYVVRWDNTPKTQVAAGLRSLRGVKLQITGLVLSQVNHRGMRRYGYTDSYSSSYNSYYDS